MANLFEMVGIRLDRRKRRKAIRRCMRQVIAGAIRSEKRAREIFMEVQNTDFATLWDDYAIAMGKHPEPLTQEEKKQAFLNHVLEKQEKPICRIFSRR